jgi:putative GTP pyrophosphokinase
MERQAGIEAALAKYSAERHIFERFRNAVVDYFRTEPLLNDPQVAVIHSIKSRLKDIDHLRDKLNRKWDEGSSVDESNVFASITDLAGVRVLHLYQDQFPLIHQSILSQLTSGDWHLHEAPKAYSWDPEASEFFKGLGLNPEIKASHYTSIHYVLKPRKDAEVCCELQVRTLFEEIWGEIDHQLNYPHRTESVACREQIRVLSKLVSTGTRLADAIFRTRAAERI